MSLLQRASAILLLTASTASAAQSGSSSMAFVIDNPSSNLYRDLNTYQPPSLSQPVSQYFSAIKTRNNNNKLHQSSTAMSNDSTNADDGAIFCSSEMDLPFSAEVAFDAFSDLTRQPSWSPWLKSVKYIDESKQESEWKMKFLGISQKWTSKGTRLQPPANHQPAIIEWESVSGMKNYGKVHFTETGPDSTHVKMTIGFKFPKMLMKMMGDKSDKVTQMIEDKMLQPTLDNFKEIVLENDLKKPKVASPIY